MPVSNSQVSNLRQSDEERLREAAFKSNVPYNAERGVHIAMSNAGAIWTYVGQPPKFEGAEFGVYRDMAGKVVSDHVARLAGFDVDGDALKKRKQERMAQARMKIDALWQAEQDAIRRGDYTPPPAAPEQQTETEEHPDVEFGRKLADAA
jgi:hypothetical protein